MPASTPPLPRLLQAANYKYFAVQGGGGQKCYGASSIAYATKAASVSCFGVFPSTCANQVFTVDQALATAAAAPASPAPPAAQISCASSLSCLMDWGAMDAQGAAFPALSSKDAGTGERSLAGWHDDDALPHAAPRPPLSCWEYAWHPAGSLFASFPLSRFLKASMQLSNQALCNLAIKGSALNNWSVSGLAPAWAQGFLSTVSVTG